MRRVIGRLTRTTAEQIELDPALNRGKVTTEVTDQTICIDKNQLPLAKSLRKVYFHAKKRAGAGIDHAN